ncbi:hypothetical protein [Halorubellus litoreus]|uniref:Tat (Twin-arginine translocation) pathway signal sequence n=1 Tax=Halorubellus litoreus TaxID=755308 RepID=A0ABD5VDR2_9EURY
MANRRKFISSAGALAALGTTGIAAATKRPDELTAEEVSEAFQDGVVNNGAAGARKNWEELGLNPVVEESQDFEIHDNTGLHTTAGPDEGSEVSPQYKYGDPKNTDSKLISGVSDAGDGKVWMSVAMKLTDPQRSWGNASWVKDGIGIGYIAKDWAPIGEPVVNATEPHSARFRSEDVSQDARAGTVNIKNPGGDDLYPDASANITAKFELRPDKIPTTLWGSYSHTKALSPGSNIKSVTGGAGGIELNLDLGASTAWSIAYPSDPSDFV